MEDSESTDAQDSSSSGRIDAFAGAQHVHVNDLRFFQAQNVHTHNHSTTSHPIELSEILHPLDDASHKRNRKVAPPDSTCLAGTRESLFRELGLWVRGGIMTQQPPRSPRRRDPLPRKPICWMYGPFGCGKSAVAQTLAEWYAQKGRIAATFFFSRNAGDRSSSNRLATTIAHQIALNVPGARELIRRVVIREPGVVKSSRALGSQLQDLVYGPLLASLAEGGVANDDPYLVIIDGIDECVDKEGIATFIDTSTQFFSHNPDVPLRLFITSRVEECIRSHIEDGTATIHLADLAYRSSRADISHYMAVFFAEARKRDRALQALGELWPASDEMDELVEYCDGSFVVASTLAKFISRGLGDNDPRTPMERLPLALKAIPEIDGVYVEILSCAQHLPHFHTIISTIACAFNPLSVSAIAALLGLTTYEIIRVVVPLQAILHVPGRDDEPVTVFHASFRAFILDESRSANFYTPSSHHTYLMHRSLGLLFGTQPTTNTECCKYAIIYWGAHLEIGARLDAAFNLDTLQSDHPYNPIDRGEWATRHFKSYRGEARPLKFTLSMFEVSTMTQSMAASFRLFSLQKFNGVYYRDNLNPSRWSCLRPAGKGSLSSLKSLHISSFGDIVQGLRVLRFEGTASRDGFDLTMRRGDGVCIFVKWTRVDNPQARKIQFEISIEDIVDTG